MNLHGTKLQEELLRKLETEVLNSEDRVLVCCQLSKEFEDAGNYEAASDILGDRWRGVGQRPRVDDLSEMSRGELLLRTGALSGFIGQAKQLEGSQEQAKDLITESHVIFEKLNEKVKVAEALTELGFCYWRSGAFDDARVTLRTALQALGDFDGDLKAVAILRLAIVENSASNFKEALRILESGAHLFLTSSNPSLVGKYHMNLAIFLKNVSQREKDATYIDRALLEFAAASFHLEQAGHTRYLARSENNLGFMLFNIGKFAEAHEHLDRAYNLFTSLKETSNAGQVDDTRARAFLTEGRFSEAIYASRRAVAAQEKGDEQALLAEALITHGIALARIGKQSGSRAALARAARIYEGLGEKEGTALANLTMIEELSGYISADQLRGLYYIADQLIGESREPEILSKLRNSANILLALEEYEEIRRSPKILPEFIHASSRISSLLEDAKRIALTPGTVLITGEPGTGKELLAKYIHERSGRAGRMVNVDCSDLSDAILESKLFGHVRGSFTGAANDSAGLVAQAEGGTLFLDEIGELSPGDQAIVLRLIENCEALKAGGVESGPIDVRIIAATSRDLSAMVHRGEFREELYYRINRFQLDIPPLRERPEDIAALTAYLVKEQCRHQGKKVTFAEEAVRELTLLPLKGNVRELRTLIERAVMLAQESAIIRGEDITTAIFRSSEFPSFANARVGCDLNKEVEKFEAELIRVALKAAGGRISHAAQLLGLSHQNLCGKLEGKYSYLSEDRSPVKRRPFKSIIGKRTKADSGKAK